MGSFLFSQCSFSEVSFLGLGTSSHKWVQSSKVRLFKVQKFKSSKFVFVFFLKVFKCSSVHIVILVICSPYEKTYIVFFVGKCMDKKVLREDI